MKPSWFTFETVIESLREFMDKFEIPVGKKIALILDNAPWHRKAIRLIQKEQLPEYQDIRDKFELVSLPPYSPDLNPIEQCWRVTRREITHNRYFPSKEHLENKLDEYFGKFRQANDKFRTLCGWRKISNPI